MVLDSLWEKLGVVLRTAELVSVGWVTSEPVIYSSLAEALRVGSDSGWATCDAVVSGCPGEMAGVGIMPVTFDPEEPSPGLVTSEVIIPGTPGEMVKGGMAEPVCGPGRVTHEDAVSGTPTGTVGFGILALELVSDEVIIFVPPGETVEAEMLKLDSSTGLVVVKSSVLD